MPLHLTFQPNDRGKNSAYGSLITFAAWSSFAHASVMAIMVVRDARARDEWPAVALLTVIGVALIVLAPAKPSGERVSAAGA